MVQNKIKSKNIFLLILLVIIVSVLIAVWTNAMQHRKATEVRKQITALRANSEQINDNKIKQQIAFLQNTGVVDTHITSSKADVCYVKNLGDGYGIFPGGWKQICYLRYVEGYTTQLNREQIISTLHDLQNIELLFGEKTGYFCGLYEQSGRETILFTPGKNSEDVKLFVSCEPPSKIKDGNSVKGGLAVYREDSLNVKVFRDFDTEKLDYSKNQIWLVIQEDYYQESIICWEILCNNTPRKNPISVEELSEREIYY